MTDSIEHGQLRAFVERLERMAEERKAIADDISEIYAEAKGNGFDTKALKIVIRKRAMDPNERLELEAIVDLYESALGGSPAPAHARVETIEQFPSNAREQSA
ncbi:MAG: DUF2312 domain-containing protein [Devosia sp.]